MATSLSLPVASGRWALGTIAACVAIAASCRRRAVAPLIIARSTLFARAVGTRAALAVAIAVEIFTAPVGTGTFRRGTALAISVTPQFTSWGGRTVTIASHSFRTPSLFATFAAWTLVPPSFRPSTLGTPSLFATLATWTLVPASFRTPAFRARALFALGAAISAFRPTICIARRTHLVGSDATVAVAVELADDLSRPAEFCRVNRTVMVRIESTEESRQRALIFGALTFALRSAFALRAALALRRIRRSVGSALLRAERPGRKRERHGGDELRDWFHGDGNGLIGWQRASLRAFTTG